MLLLGALALDLGLFPIALFLLVLPLPVAYAFRRNREAGNAVLVLALACAAVVALYPAVFYLSDVLGIVGYALGKLALFVLIPLVALAYAERRRIHEILPLLGVRRQNLPRSLVLGGIAAVITIAVTTLATSAQPVDVFVSGVLFFEAFTEEFLFRGVLLVYLATKTSLRVAYATSILGFILIHPQNFDSWFLVSTVLQAVLLAVVAMRTQNLAGPWVAHGLNRTVPPLILLLLGP